MLSSLLLLGTVAIAIIALSKDDKPDPSKPAPPGGGGGGAAPPGTPPIPGGGGVLPSVPPMGECLDAGLTPLMMSQVNEALSKSVDPVALEKFATVLATLGFPKAADCLFKKAAQLRGAVPPGTPQPTKPTPPGDKPYPGSGDDPVPPKPPPFPGVPIPIDPSAPIMPINPNCFDPSMMSSPVLVGNLGIVLTADPNLYSPAQRAKIGPILRDQWAPEWEKRGFPSAAKCIREKADTF